MATDGSNATCKTRLRMVAWFLLCNVSFTGRIESYGCAARMILLQGGGGLLESDAISGILRMVTGTYCHVQLAAYGSPALIPAY